jgi:hypothetical protein
MQGLSHGHSADVPSQGQLSEQSKILCDVLELKNEVKELREEVRAEAKARLFSQQNFLESIAALYEQFEHDQAMRNYNTTKLDDYIFEESRAKAKLIGAVDMLRRRLVTSSERNQIPERESSDRRMPVQELCELPSNTDLKRLIQDTQTIAPTRKEHRNGSYSTLESQMANFQYDFSVERSERGELAVELVELKADSIAQFKKITQDIGAMSLELQSFITRHERKRSGFPNPALSEGILKEVAEHITSEVLERVSESTRTEVVRAMNEESQTLVSRTEFDGQTSRLWEAIRINQESNVLEDATAKLKGTGIAESHLTRGEFENSVQVIWKAIVQLQTSQQHDLKKQGSGRQWYSSPLRQVGRGVHSASPRQQSVGRTPSKPSPRQEVHPMESVKVYDRMRRSTTS